MTDYNKQTVAQLRQLLKDRGIPSTGLQRKAQIIEKLEEADNEAASADEGAARDLGAVSEPAKEAEEREASSGSSPESEPISVLKPQPDAAEDNAKDVETREEKATAEEPVELSTQAVVGAPASELNNGREYEASDTEAMEIEDNQSSEEKVENDPLSAQKPPAIEMEAAQERSELMSDTRKAPTLSPGPNAALTVEKSESLGAPEQDVADSSRLNTEELEADSRKRKRRSGTPELPSEDARIKKARPNHEPAPKVYLPEDVNMEQEQGKEKDTDVGEAEATPKENQPAPQQADKSMESQETQELAKEQKLSYPHTDTTEPLPHDSQPTHSVSPSLHPATPALYIRNFMRPLRPPTLHAHLSSLAQAPGTSPSTSPIHTLYLDLLKTHAFVRLSSTAGACRIRAALHSTVWPAEANRKALFVDYIPEEKVAEWVQTEEDAAAAEKAARAAGRPIAARRFEVVYPVSEDGSVTAIFQELGSTTHTTTISAGTPTPTITPTTNSTTTALSKPDLATPFRTLDSLFQTTATKPTLYFLPVSDATADARLAELARVTSQDWDVEERRRGRGMRGEVCWKYCFDGEGRVVEGGVEGAWGEEGRVAGAAGRGGRGGGGFGGGYRGWGRGRGGWRG